jgi:hypothetical protein
VKKRRRAHSPEEKHVPQIDSSVLDAAANVDPIRLAILFVGLTSLGVIWLASVIIKYFGRRK